MIRWAQARSGEMMEAVEQAVEQNPELSTFRPTLAVIYCEAGRLEEARTMLEEESVDGFASVARDVLWLATINRWAEVAAETGALDAAETLYRLLEPWADQFPFAGLTVRPPVRMNLGMLAASLDRHEEAEISLRAGH